MSDKFISNLKFGIKIDGQEFAEGTKDLQTKVKALDTDVKKASGSTKDLGNNMKEGAQQAQNFGGAIAKYLSFTVVIAGIVKFTKSLFTLGSQLQETESRFNVVFKGIEEKATQAFDQLAESAGRSRLDMKEFGSTIANILKPLGFATGDALELSKSFVQLGVDMASFFNVSDAQVMDAINGAIAGRTMGLRSLGLVIDQQDIKEEAYRQGIAKTGNELTKQQTTLALYSLVLKNTTDAQGEAIRSADGWANQVKALRGVIKDTFAEAGKDVISQSGGFLKTLTTFVEAYGKGLVKTTIDTAKAILGLLDAALAGFTDTFNKINKTAEDGTKRELGILDLFVIGIQGILTGLQLFMGGAKAVIEAIGTVFGDVIAGILNSGKGFASLMFDIFKTLGIGVEGAFVSIGDKVISALADIANGAIKAINFVIKGINVLPKVDLPTIDLFDKPEAKAGEFADRFKQSLGAIGDDIKNINQIMGIDWDKTWSDAGKKLTDFASKAKGTIEDLGAQVIKSQSKQDKALGSTSDEASNLQKTLKDLIDKYNKEKPDSNVAKEIVQSVKEVEKFGEALKKTMSDVTGIHHKFGTEVRDVARTIRDELKKVTDPSYVPKVHTAELKTWDELKEAVGTVKNAVDDLKSAHKSFIDEAKKGVEDYAKELKDSIKDSAVDIVSSYEDAVARLEEIKTESAENANSGTFDQTRQDALDKEKSQLEDVVATYNEIVKSGDVYAQKITEADERIKRLTDTIARLKEEGAPASTIKEQEDVLIQAQQERLILIGKQLLATQGLTDIQKAQAEAELKTKDAIEAEAYALGVKKQRLDEIKAVNEAIADGTIGTFDTSTLTSQDAIDLASSGKTELETYESNLKAQQGLLETYKEMELNLYLTTSKSIGEIQDGLIAHLTLGYDALILKLQQVKQQADDAFASASRVVSYTPSESQAVSNSPVGDVMSEFESGGYTGAGQTNEVKGVVHAEEWVANARFVRDNKSLISALDRLQRKGYQNGGSVTKNVTFNPVVHHKVGLRAVMKEAKYFLR